MKQDDYEELSYGPDFSLDEQEAEERSISAKLQDDADVDEELADALAQSILKDVLIKFRPDLFSTFSVCLVCNCYWKGSPDICGNCGKRPQPAMS